MSLIACPGCGGQFPLAQVAAYETFTCSSCGHVVKVPVAAPTPVVQPVQPVQPPRPAQAARPAQGAKPAPPAAQQRAAQPARPAAQRSAASPARGAQPAQKAAARRAAPPPEPEAETRRRGGGRSRPSRGGDDAPARKAPPVGLLVGVGVVVVGGIAAILLTRNGDADLPPPQTLDQAAAAQPSGPTPATAAPVATATEPVTPPQPAEPERIDVIPLIKQKLRECEFADEVSADPVYRLRLLMAKNTDKRGKWEAQGEQLAKVRKLLDETAAADKKLRSSDAEMARAQWITYIRTIEVMKDYPMLHATVGPYLIFVQVKTKPGTTIDEADPEAVAKAQEILDRNVYLFEHFYEGWMTNVAPVFGFERYTEDNVEKETIFKATVFADHASYMQYNIRIGAGGTASSARAYYSKQEPRFICTYEGKAEKKEGDEAPDDGGYSETREYIDHVQCHEATHQLVHFYTWDTTRKAIGRKPRWLDSLTRPLWSTEGFAEFFSSHEEKNGVFTWMVPLDNRMRELWVFQEIIQEKGWKPWELDQLLSLRNGGQLQSLGMARAIDPADRGAAVMVMANNFYAEAWSLNYFLWYAEEGGAPKWRDKLIAYYKQEFELDYGQKDGKSGDELARSPRLMLEGDFFRAMGLEDPAAQQAFYAEWKAYEKALLEKHRSPEWDKERARIRKMIGMKAD